MANCFVKIAVRASAHLSIYAVYFVHISCLKVRSSLNLTDFVQIALKIEGHTRVFTSIFNCDMGEIS